jgi:hypothetical protein
MVSVIALSALDCWFESRSRQTKDYKIGICCFSTKHAALRRKCRLVGLESGLEYSWDSTLQNVCFCVDQKPMMARTMNQ